MPKHKTRTSHIPIHKHKPNILEEERKDDMKDEGKENGYEPYVHDIQINDQKEKPKRHHRQDTVKVNQDNSDVGFDVESNDLKFEHSVQDIEDFYLHSHSPSPSTSKSDKIKTKSKVNSELEAWKSNIDIDAVDSIYDSVSFPNRRQQPENQHQHRGLFKQHIKTVIDAIRSVFSLSLLTAAYFATVTYKAVKALTKTFFLYIKYLASPFYLFINSSLTLLIVLGRPFYKANKTWINKSFRWGTNMMKLGTGLMITVVENVWGRIEKLTERLWGPVLDQNEVQEVKEEKEPGREICVEREIERDRE